MAVNDDAAAVGKFELEHAFTLGFAVAISPAFIQRLRDPQQCRVGQAFEFARCHRRDKLVFNKLTIGIAMRRAAALILVCLALSACGNKAALYLPPPEQNPQQDNKPAPRQ